MVLTLLPTLVLSSGDGNILLLEDEVAIALKTCSEGENPSRDTQKQKRSADAGSPRIDGGNSQGLNQYSHERRNMTGERDQMFVINATDYDYDYGSGNGGENVVISMAKAADEGSYPNVDPNGNTLNRTRRSEPLLNKEDNDQVSMSVAGSKTYLSMYMFGK